MRSLAPLLLPALLLATAPIGVQTASANPGKVAEILGKSGNSGVARGPGTIDNQAKAKIADMAEKLASKTGGKAYVVIVNKDTGIGAYAKVYDSMGLGARDVLIVSNGPKWALRCDGISKADKNKLLARVMKAKGDPMARMQGLMSGIPAALASSQGKAKSGGSGRKSGSGGRTSAPPVQESSSGFGMGAVFFLLLLVGGVGFVIWRRKQRDARLDADFAAAIGPAEEAMAEFYLGSDGLEAHPQFDSLLSRATALSTEIDTLKAGTPTREAISKAKSLARQAKEIDQQRRLLN